MRAILVEFQLSRKEDSIKGHRGSGVQSASDKAHLTPSHCTEVLFFFFVACYQLLIFSTLLFLLSCPFISHFLYQFYSEQK